MRARDKGAALTAYCGLYCGDCLRYASNVPDLARDLRAKLAEAKFESYAHVKSTQVRELADYEGFLQVLDAIVKLKCSTPCRSGGDGCSVACDIKGCVQGRGLEGCWECKELANCDKFEHFKPFHGNVPRQNATKIKEYGLDKWATHRGKFYTWL